MAVDLQIADIGFVRAVRIQRPLASRRRDKYKDIDVDLWASRNIQVNGLRAPTPVFGRECVRENTYQLSVI